jgi:hypothetical protein
MRLTEIRTSWSEHPYSYRKNIVLYTCIFEKFKTILDTFEKEKKNPAIKLVTVGYVVLGPGNQEKNE